MELQKLVDENIKMDDEMARTLPTETKKTFWRAFNDDGLTIGEARRVAGIEDVGVAISLIIQCYKTVATPMEVDEIE